MKTSNIQTTHGQAIIRGWVDPAGLAASGGTVTSPHENASGVAFAAGDVVVLASDNTVVLTTTAQDTRRIGVALDDIPWGSTGPIAWQGPVPRVNVTSIVTEGSFAETAGIAGVATSYPVRRVGSFGYFTSSGSAPSAYIFGAVDSGTGDAFELNTEGGQDVIKAHAAMGTTETFNPADGNVHTGLLDDDCTFTITAPTGSGAATLELWITGSGTHTWTWPGSVTWDGGVTGDPPADATTVRVILETIDGGSNWVANMVGGGGSVGALDDLSDVTITSPTLDDDLRYNGSLWVNDFRKWEAVTGGEDIFVWSGDDLVYDWSV